MVKKTFPFIARHHSSERVGKGYFGPSRLSFLLRLRAKSTHSAVYRKQFCAHNVNTVKLSLRCLATGWRRIWEVEGAWIGGKRSMAEKRRWERDHWLLPLVSVQSASMCTCLLAQTEEWEKRGWEVHMMAPVLSTCAAQKGSGERQSVVEQRYDITSHHTS